MINTFPQQDKQFIQPNNGRLLGNVFMTRNVNFVQPGIVSLSPRTKYVYTGDSDADFEDVCAIVYGKFDGSTFKYYYVTNNDIFESASNLTSFTQATGSPATSNNSDAVAFNGGMYVTVSANLSSYIAGTWVNSLFSLDSAYPHPLCVSASNNLLIGDGNIMRFRTAAGTNSVTGENMVFASNNEIRWIRLIAGEHWVGTRNTTGGDVSVFRFASEGSTDPDFEYKIQGATWAMAGEGVNGVLHVVTNDGRLMRFNGAGFTEAARFPIYQKILESNLILYNNFSVWFNLCQRGMAVVDGKLHINIDVNMQDSSASFYFPELPGGIWCYDEGVGLYHKYGASSFQSENDFCQTYIARPGAIMAMTLNPASIPASATGGTLLYGIRPYGATQAASPYLLGSVTTGENRGVIGTPRLESGEVAEAWKYVWVKHRKLFDSTDKIAVKYKTEDRDAVPFYVSGNGNMSWTSTTSFTTTSTSFSAAERGDEVTVLSGNGAGASSHISEISFANPTYTVTLDEAIPGVSNGNSGAFIVDNYRRIDTITSTPTSPNTATFSKLTIPNSESQVTPSTWIMLKFELRGEGVQLEQAKLLSETQFKVII